jgi:hypothetical protein
MIEKIFAGTDCSTFNAIADRVSAELTCNTGAELTVLHALMHGEAFSLIPLSRNVEDTRFCHQLIQTIGKHIAEDAATQTHEFGAASIASAIPDTAKPLVTYLTVVSS